MTAVTPWIAAGAPVARPLSGIRVLDFTGHAAGPYCTLMLALLGADVIRIETRTRLDIQRRPHPVYGRVEVPNFDHLAGHKRSITLNLKKPAAIAIAKELVAVSDVVVENYRPGVMERLGLDWPAIANLNPRAVMLSISAYGQKGPDAQKPGYAPIFAAEGALGWLTGYPDGPPAESRNQMDHQAGLTAAFVGLALLEEREQTGRGAYADVSAREVAAMLVGESILSALATGSSRRIGNGDELRSPHGVYPAAGEDRWIAIAVRSDAEWRALVEIVDLPELCRPAYAVEAGRRAATAAIDDALSSWTRQQDAGEAARRLQDAGVCADVSMSARDLITDEHLLARGAITTLRHADHGERLTVQAPWRFRHANVAYEEWSPALGAHNEEVVCGLLGHRREQLEEWIVAQVVY